ncbi:chromosome partitioning protein [Virgisporangium aliadipatigenens]|uniref:chromosome partitioning protein n=1 Tax=Virgisporangium aliadipatigenens TaxID=741659 RepID=UPI00403304EF
MPGVPPYGSPPQGYGPGQAPAVPPGASPSAPMPLGHTSGAPAPGAPMPPGYPPAGPPPRGYPGGEPPIVGGPGSRAGEPPVPGYEPGGPSTFGGPPVVGGPGSRAGEPPVVGYPTGAGPQTSGGPAPGYQAADPGGPGGRSESQTPPGYPSGAPMQGYPPPNAPEGHQPPAPGYAAPPPGYGPQQPYGAGPESTPPAQHSPGGQGAPGSPGAQQPATGGPGAESPGGGQFPQNQGENDGYVPTAEEFARRRAVRPTSPVASMGVRGIVRKSTMGLVSLAPGRREQEQRHLVETVRRNFGGLRQVTVVNPKGGAGKTVAVLLMSMTFGQRRGGYVLAWDNNETQGTLGMRAQQDFHSRTVRDMLRDLNHFQGPTGRVGDLSQYVRSQGEGMFDVLASDESATAGEMLTSAAFGDLREVVSRFYKLIFVDTGNNVRAENWQAAIDATDQLVVTMSARNDSAETAARMLDHLEQNGRHRLVRQAVTVVSMPPSRRDLDIPSITRHFAARTRTVMLAPYERLIDSGEPIRYGQISAPTRLAWLRIAAAVAEGL